MENVQIDNLNINEDILLAEGVISGKIVSNTYSFNDHSIVYRTTNENVSHEPYIKALKDRKRVLSISASGDQIVNSILFGGVDIIGVDICRFSKYFVALKLAAIKELTKEEYLRYIVGDQDYLPLAYNLYEKVRNSLPQEALGFWDRIFTRFSEKEIDSSSFFGSFNLSQRRMTLNNPYLQGENYNTLKDKIDGASLLLFDSDIYDFRRREFGDFDLILLSNVFNYLRYNYIVKSSDAAKEYKKFLSALPLKRGGVAVTYNFIFDGSIKEDFRGEEYETFKVEENLQSSIKLDNEIMIYTKKKRKFPFFR